MYVLLCWQHAHAVPVACLCHNAQSRRNTGGGHKRLLRTTGGLHAGHHHSNIMLWYVPVELHSSQNPQPGGNCSGRSRALHPPLQLLHQAGSWLQSILLQLLRGPHRFLVASGTRAGGGVSSQLHGVIIAQRSKCQAAMCCYVCCCCSAATLLLCSCHAAAWLLPCCCTAAAASGLQLHSCNPIAARGCPLGRCHCSIVDGAGAAVLGARSPTVQSGGSVGAHSCPQTRHLVLSDCSQRATLIFAHSCSTMAAPRLQAPDALTMM
jgi:hypothetical protein